MAAQQNDLRRLASLETIIVSLDEAIEASDIADVARVIARGFVELGAVMVGLYVVEGEQLRPVGRWPEDAADALFANLHPSGGPLADFRIPLCDEDNPYVQVLRAGQTKIIRGSESVADHILATYGAPETVRKPLIAALYGKSSAIVPLLAGNRAVGVAGLNYAETLGESERHLFSIFGRSAGTLLNFKREVISREAIAADLEVALAKERKTRDALNRAERLNALGEMSAVVAHEIRNPVAVIKNSASALRRHIGGDEQAKMLCAIVDEETASIERIIDDMLAFSSPLELGGSMTAVSDIVDKAVYLIGERSAGRTDVTVSHSEEELAPISADSHRISHALVNLIANARHATRTSGTVEVRTSSIMKGDRAFVRVQVVDTGCGIALSELDHVFQPFFTTKEDGTGLGLALVKRIVDAHGGRIFIDSELGNGTTVTIDLPYAESED
jgi:signal transduction histidine kinase